MSTPQGEMNAPGHAMQPGASPEMTMAHPPQAQPQQQPKEQGALRTATGTYVNGVAKEAGEQTAKYEATNGQQQLDDAKAQAQGLWAKYCGCFGSLG